MGRLGKHYCSSLADAELSYPVGEAIAKADGAICIPRTVALMHRKVLYFDRGVALMHRKVLSTRCAVISP